MSQFCGQDKCLVDANGRIKLSPHFLVDFRLTGPDLMLHCLTEGGLAIYPASTWHQMRQAEPRPAARAAASVVFRRQLRRFGSFSQPETLSNQGRITVPPRFREVLALTPGTDSVLVGCEIGVELWNAERWMAESALVWQHETRKGDAEMDADLGTPSKVWE